MSITKLCTLSDVFHWNIYFKQDWPTLVCINKLCTSEIPAIKAKFFHTAEIPKSWHCCMPLSLLVWASNQCQQATDPFWLRFKIYYSLAQRFPTFFHDPVICILLPLWLREIITSRKLSDKQEKAITAFWYLMMCKI